MCLSVSGVDHLCTAGSVFGPTESRCIVSRCPNPADADNNRSAAKCLRPDDKDQDLLAAGKAKREVDPLSGMQRVVADLVDRRKTLLRGSRPFWPRPRTNAPSEL